MAPTPARRIARWALALTLIGVPVAIARPAAAAVCCPSGPYSWILSPASGSRHPVGAPLTVTGKAANGESGGIISVEVSVDDGVSWHLVGSGETPWSYTFTPTEPGKITILTRAATVEHVEAPHQAVTVVVGPDDGLDRFGCPCGLWFNTSDYSPAADGDDQAVEVGVRFQASSDGLVTGLRFLKYAGNTGTHVGHLWSATGTLLGEAAFTDETADGWQQVTFSQPVAVQANHVYVASYYAPAGHYASTTDYFNYGEFTSPPLMTVQQPYNPALGIAPGPGVYSYGGGFPTDAWQDSNYWVTPVFVAS